MSNARIIAATTAETDIAPGTPEKAYQSVIRAKMLWSFRLRDVDSWQAVIDDWCDDPPAWERIPEFKPYGTPRAMIEAEVCENYDAFLAFIEMVLGTEYGAKLREPLAPADHPGTGRGNKTIDNYQSFSVDTEGGTSREYLLRRLHRDRPDILKRLDAGELRSVRAAAIEAGIVKNERRVSIPLDPYKAAQTIRRTFTPEQVDELIDELTND